MVSRKTLDLLRLRSKEVCELCGIRFATNTHHRKPRGMGGTRDAAIDAPSNLIRLCGSGTHGCHGYIESHRDWAYDEGLLVRRCDSPLTIPVRLARGKVRLNDDGGYDSVE